MGKIKFKPPIPYLWALFILWFLYGEVVAYGISEGFLRNLAYVVWDSALRHVPSINRIKDEFAFDTGQARMIVSVMMLSMPVLLLFMLLIDFDVLCQGVRKKGKEARAILIFVIVGSLIFLGGFGITHSTKMLSHSVYGYVAKVVFMTYFCCYAYRMVICLAFKR